MNKTQKKILDAAFDILAQDFSAPLDKVARSRRGYAYDPTSLLQ